MRIRGIALTLCAFLTVGLVATTAGASNDTDFAKQWSLAKIHAPEAWAHTTGRGVRVGIVDTGVDLNHEDLVGKVVEGTSCVGAAGDPAKCSGSPQDDQGHGTHVAGIIAAIKDNGIGVAGVVGAGCLVLSAYGLAVLPTRWLGLALVVAGLAGFAIDVQAGAPRFWTAGKQRFW